MAPQQRLDTKTIRELVLDFFDNAQYARYSWSVTDVTRVVDAVLSTNRDVRVAHRDLVRTVLSELVRDGELSSRAVLPSERPKSARGTMLIYSRLREADEHPLEDRLERLSHLPETRKPTHVLVATRPRTRAAAANASASTNGDGDGDVESRGRLLVSLVTELARDADDVAALRARVAELERDLERATAELERANDENTRLKKRARVADRARALLQGLDE